MGPVKHLAVIVSYIYWPIGMPRLSTVTLAGLIISLIIVLTIMLFYVGTR